LYFNGTEVYRSSNLPQPTAVITPTTLAVPDQGDNFQEMVTLSRNALVAGPNLAAIEMHQQSASSSDLSLNLELMGNPLPRLDLLRFGSDWLLVWSDASFSLEQATQITGPWTRLSTKSPAPLTLEAATRFYRLAK